MTYSPPPDARSHLRYVAAHMHEVFGREPHLDQAIGFVAGFDAAWGYSLLRGFHEWLVVKLGDGFNTHWFGLVRRIVVDEPASQLDQLEAQVVERFFEVVLEFLDDIETLQGRRRLYLGFENLVGDRGEFWSTE